MSSAIPFRPSASASFSPPGFKAVNRVAGLVRAGLLEIVTEPYPSIAERMMTDSAPETARSSPAAARAAGR